MDRIPLDNLGRELQRLGDDAFRSKYPHPFLVVQGNPPPETDFLELRTTASSTVAELGSRAGAGDMPSAVSLVKTERNAFKSKITVGRARNNDIVIRSIKISKVHAVFVQDEDGAFSLMDMGSANGTFVEDEPIERDRWVPLTDGASLAIWRYRFRFYGPDAFIKFLREGQQLA